MSNPTKSLFFIVLLLASGTANVEAQDYINQSLRSVERALKAERVPYKVSLLGTESIISLVEAGDTLIWKFGENERCYEYIMVMHAGQYMDMRKHLELVAQEVIRNVYLNRRDNTVTYVRKENKTMTVNTRSFDPYASTPPILISSSE